MKLRHGFVSNSSSSSFIVAVEPGKTKVKLTLEFDLSELALKIENLEALQEHFTEDIGIDVEETFQEGSWEDEHKQRFLQAKKALEDGKEVLKGCVSSEDEGLSPFLYENGLEFVKAIEGAEGAEIIQSPER